MSVSEEIVKDLNSRVARGSLLLDTHIPGWYNKISMNLLDVESNCNCILGQLYKGSFVWGRNSLELDKTPYLACEFGFGLGDLVNTYGGDKVFKEFYPLLNNIWRRTIKKRRLIDEIASLCEEEEIVQC